MKEKTTNHSFACQSALQKLITHQRKKHVPQNIARNALLAAGSFYRKVK